VVFGGRENTRLIAWVVVQQKGCVLGVTWVGEGGFVGWRGAETFEKKHFWG